MIDNFVITVRKYCGSLCNTLSGRGGRNASAIDIAKKDGINEKVLPDVETKILFQEKSLGLGEVYYEKFIYAIKRYSYKGSPLQENMMSEISKEINLDFSKISSTAKDKTNLLYQTYKHPFFFEKGSFNVENLLCLGYLHCHMADTDNMKEEFW